MKRDREEVKVVWFGLVWLKLSGIIISCHKNIFMSTSYDVILRSIKSCFLHRPELASNADAGSRQKHTMYMEEEKGSESEHYNIYY